MDVVQRQSLTGDVSICLDSWLSDSSVKSAVSQTHSRERLVMCLWAALSLFLLLSTVDDYSPHQKVRETVETKKNLPKNEYLVK